MYNYTGCGLPYIWLRNGYTTRETEYGEVTSVSDVEGLHRVVAMDIVNSNPALTGEEVRFLRKELELSQVNLASGLGVSESTIRGWENNRQPVSPPAERLLRVLCQEHFSGNSHVRELIRKISEQNHDEYLQQRRITLESSENGWHKTSEAA